LLGLPAAEALAEADEQEERSDAPGDAEHGEKRAQLVAQRVAKDWRTISMSMRMGIGMKSGS